MTAVPAPAVTGLLQAISDRLTIPAGPCYDTDYLLELRAASSDVRLACSAILARHADPAAVAQFTQLLSGLRPVTVPAAPPPAGLDAEYEPAGTVTHA